MSNKTPKSIKNKVAAFTRKLVNAAAQRKPKIIFDPSLKMPKNRSRRRNQFNIPRNIASVAMGKSIVQSKGMPLRGAPVNFSVSKTSNPMYFHSVINTDGLTGIRVAGDCLAYTVNLTQSSKGTVLARIPLNPFFFDKRIAAQAKLYDMFYIESLEVELISSLNTTREGTLMGYFDLDAADNINDTEPEERSEVASFHKRAKAFGIWTPSEKWNCPIMKQSPLNWFFTTHDFLQPRLTSQGTFNLLIDQPTSVTGIIGSLFFRYKIAFVNPSDDLGIESFTAATSLPNPSTGTQFLPFSYNPVLNGDQLNYHIINSGSGDVQIYSLPTTGKFMVNLSIGGGTALTTSQPISINNAQDNKGTYTIGAVGVSNSSVTNTGLTALSAVAMVVVTGNPLASQNGIYINLGAASGSASNGSTQFCTMRIVKVIDTIKSKLDPVTKAVMKANDEIKELKNMILNQEHTWDRVPIYQLPNMIVEEKEPVRRSTTPTRTIPRN